MKQFAKRFSTVLIALLILAVGVGISLLLWKTRPIAEKKPSEQSFPVVEYREISYAPRTFSIPSQGIIESSRRSVLASEVAGKIIETSDRFDPGYEVKKGEILLRIDPVDYEAAVAQAKSTLADTVAALETEKALAAQAKRDWEQLGRGETPTDLVLRGPQLRSAEAKLEAAKSDLVRTENDLKRATVRAPYDAIISSTSTEIGSYLTPGSPIAEVFQTDPYEIRLPLSVDEVWFLEKGPDGKPQGEVKIQAETAGKRATWTGDIVRTEGEVDRQSRSVYLVAEVSAKSDDGLTTLQPGQFTRAGIPSREIPNLAAIPFSAFLDLERITIVDEENKLRIRTTEVVFREGETVYISGGPKEGERLCITELSRMIEGDQVEPVKAGSLNAKEEKNLEVEVEP